MFIKIWILKNVDLKYYIKIRIVCLLKLIKKMTFKNMDKIPDVQKDLRLYMTEHVYIEL